MSITINSGFTLKSNNPIDKRMILTKEEMVNMPDSNMPELYLCVCKDDGSIYIYNKANTVDAQTGKFRIVEAEPASPAKLRFTGKEMDATFLSSCNSGDIVISYADINEEEGGDLTKCKYHSWDTLADMPRISGDIKKYQIATNTSGTKEAIIDSYITATILPIDISDAVLMRDSITWFTGGVIAVASIAINTSGEIVKTIKVTNTAGKSDAEIIAMTPSDTRETGLVSWIVSK